MFEDGVETKLYLTWISAESICLLQRFVVSKSVWLSSFIRQQIPAQMWRAGNSRFKGRSTQLLHYIGFVYAALRGYRDPCWSFVESRNQFDKFLNGTANWTSAAATSSPRSLKPNPSAYYVWLENRGTSIWTSAFFFYWQASLGVKTESGAVRLGRHLPSHRRSLAEWSDLISRTALITQQMGTERSVTETKTNPRVDYGPCGVRVRVQSGWLFWLSVQKKNDCSRLLRTQARRCFLFTPAPPFVSQHLAPVTPASRLSS